LSRFILLTHPEVRIDPDIPVPDWPLSPHGAARMRAALQRPWVSGLRHIASSGERKAREAAAILATHLGLPVSVHEGLGENDRSSTGFLPKAKFEATASQFFARPTESVRGWERAVDAQARMVATVERVQAESRPEGDTVIVAHGAVGALLLCHLAQRPIGRDADQPGEEGGNLFAFERTSRRLLTGWQRMEEAVLPG